MATENERDGCLEITNIAADWDYTVSKPGHWPENPRLNSIEFHPGAASDRLVVKQGSDDGPVRFDSMPADSDADSRIKYFHGAKVIPYIDYDKCTFSAGHRVVIEQWGEREY